MEVALRLRLAEYLPPLLAGGWTRTGDITFYTEDNLWEHINGEATVHLQYGFRLAGSATYAADAEPLPVGSPVTVDIYAYASDLDAFGMFSQDRFETTAPGTFAAESYWSGPYLSLWRNDLLVRVQPADFREEARPATEGVALGLVESLPAIRQRPLLLRLLPSRGLIPYSVQYQRENVLGQAALQHGLLAQYQQATVNPLTMLILEETKPDLSTWETLPDYLAGGTEPQEWSLLGWQLFSADAPQYGQVLAVRSERFVLALMKIENMRRAESLLRTALAKITLALAEAENLDTNSEEE